MKTKHYIVTSGMWKDFIKIDEEIFETHESRCQEAITRSLEKWIEEPDPVGIHPLFCIAQDADDEDGDNNWIMQTTEVFKNIGRLDHLKALEEGMDEFKKELGEE